MPQYQENSQVAEQFCYEGNQVTATCGLLEFQRAITRIQWKRRLPAAVLLTGNLRRTTQAALRVRSLYFSGVDG